jgi:magnesium-transporting ATPase (P-type)
MGDGINDAPSLHAADVGISVFSAVDVAREAAEIILLKPGLDVLHKGIIEGRRASANVLKYILMGTSSNFGNMFSMAGASFLLPFLPMLPTQILLNNFLYDAAQVTIPSDNVDENSKNPFKSRPSVPLAITTILIVIVGIWLPYSPLAHRLGFTALPGPFFTFLAISTVTYLLLVQLAKGMLFSHSEM